MDDYTAAACAASQTAMERFSTSFSLASRLFAADIRPHISNIYGLVRIADEIVDTYAGNDQVTLLDALETETYQAIERGYSSDLIVHAFATSARHYGIGQDLIAPFFESMRIDANNTYTNDQYQTYIYGSAEVVGLMCLKVFVGPDDYDRLAPGAQALGSAFQKVNFLRDIKEDHEQLGRYYFPDGDYASFDDRLKQRIIQDIEQNFRAALPAIRQLPVGSRRPVKTAYRYYHELLAILKRTPADTLKRRRVSLPKQRKLLLLAAAFISR